VDAGVKAVCLLLVPALVAQGPARSFAGHWTGAIQIPGQELAFDVDLADSAGTLKGDISIPVQRLANLPLAQVAVRGDSLSFAIPGIPGNPTFHGARSSDGKAVAGQFTQAAQSFAFAMQIGAAPAAAARQARPRLRHSGAFPRPFECRVCRDR